MKFLLQYEWGTYRAAICCVTDLVMTNGPGLGVSTVKAQSGSTLVIPNTQGFVLEKSDQQPAPVRP